MKIVIGLMLVVLGAAIGLWLGLWVMFVGGIVQIINAAQVHPVHAMDVAIGVVRILSSGFIGFLSFTLLLVTGLGFIRSGLNTPKKRSI